MAKLCTWKAVLRIDKNKEVKGILPTFGTKNPLISKCMKCNGKNTKCEKYTYYEE